MYICTCISLNEESSTMDYMYTMVNSNQESESERQDYNNRRNQLDTMS